jgi:beta-glucosidase-like glycosyl hydrolase
LFQDIEPDHLPTHYKASSTTQRRDFGKQGVMCSYNLVNNTPNCASPALLNQQIRRDWGRPDALVVSDCGALGNMRGAPTNWSPEVRKRSFLAIYI